MKKAEFWNIYPDFFLPKIIHQNNQQCWFVFKNKIIDTIYKDFNTFLLKLRKI